MPLRALAAGGVACPVGGAGCARGGCLHGRDTQLRGFGRLAVAPTARLCHTVPSCTWCRVPPLGCARLGRTRPCSVQLCSLGPATPPGWLCSANCAWLAVPRRLCQATKLDNSSSANISSVTTQSSRRRARRSRFKAVPHFAFETLHEACRQRIGQRNGPGPCLCS